MPDTPASPPPPSPAWRRREHRWQLACFLGALLVYAATRFTALERFPVFFFCDEAIHSVCAHELAAHGFRSEDGELFPTFFRNFSKYNLSLSVYVQGLSAALFGESIRTVRGTAALLSLSCAAAIALALRGRGFGLREWWLGAMLLAVTPVWLVHSRTGFETALMVSCYGWFLFFYLGYRYRDPRFIFPAMLCGAGTFYAYANGQGVMALSAVLLLASDARHHWRQRRWAAAGLAFAVILFLPYLRFWYHHPDFLHEHLRDLDSYAAKSLPWSEKAAAFAGNYAQGLSPGYWFFPDQEELVRHTAPGYAHLFPWLLPFFGLGVGVCLWRWRESSHRLVLIALLAAPFSAALAGVNACRGLAFVLPANLAIALGLGLVLEQVRAAPLVLLARGGVFAGLAAAGFIVFTDCLAFGPTVSREYGLYGMQWGARELMGVAVPGWLRAFPRAQVNISSGWANGVDAFLPFFHEPPERVRFVNLEEVRAGVWNAEPDDLLTVTPDELPALRGCSLFGGFDVLGQVSRPDGEPGFYVGHLRRRADWAQQQAELRRERTEPRPDELSLNGRPATVLHPALEMGDVGALFDGDPKTVARCFQGVPMVLDVRFPQPRALAAVLVRHRDRSNFHQRVTAYAGETAISEQEDHGGMETSDPTVRVALGGRPLDRMRIEVTQGPDSWVHLRDVELVEAVALAAGPPEKPGHGTTSDDGHRPPPPPPSLH